MFEHWQQDQADHNEMIKTLSMNIGSFINPQAVQQMMQSEANTYASDDEEFDELSRRIVDQNKQSIEADKKKRRKKRAVKK